MMRALRVSPGCAVLLGLGVFGCSSAAAADGETRSKASQSALVAASAKPTPPALPADAPPAHKPPQAAFDACEGLAEGTDRSPGPPPAGSGESLDSSALERRLDKLEKDLEGPPR